MDIFDREVLLAGFDLPMSIDDRECFDIEIDKQNRAVTISIDLCHYDESDHYNDLCTEAETEEECEKIRARHKKFLEDENKRLYGYMATVLKNVFPEWGDTRACLEKFLELLSITDGEAIAIETKKKTITVESYFLHDDSVYETVELIINDRSLLYGKSLKRKLEDAKEALEEVLEEYG